MSATVSSPIPSRLLQSLVGPAATSKGAILDVGCGDGAVVRGLRGIGCTTQGIDDTLSRAADGLVQGSLSGNVPFAVHTFDAILVRGMKVYSGPLTGPEVFTATANLLSCLKPGGRLVLFEPQGFAAPGSIDAARLNAWREHLSQFPGRCDVSQFADGLGFLLSLKWLMGEKKIAATIVSMTVPSPALSRLEWHRVVRDILLGKKKRGAA